MGINTRSVRRFLYLSKLLIQISLLFIIFFPSFFSDSTSISSNMTTSTKPGGSKKRQSRPKDPPGPDRAVINRKEEEFHNLCQIFRFPSEWGAQHLTTGNTALKPPPPHTHTLHPPVI
ncbi:hypothetical protein Hanom_Chr17g01525371 [Helianthus anomalus]